MNKLLHIKNLVYKAEETRKDSFGHDKWCGSGYIGIDWTPVRKKEWIEIKKLLEIVE